VETNGTAQWAFNLVNSSHWSSFLSPGIFQWLERFRLRRVKAHCTVPLALRSSEFGNLLETWVQIPLKPEKKRGETFNI
jgi:hypothetical protein